MRTIAYAAAVLVATAFFVRRGLVGAEGDFTSPRRAVIAAEGATRLKVTSGDGELRVVAVDGAPEVRVRGTAHATRERGLRGVRLELRREGNEVHVRSAIAKARSRDDGGSRAWHEQLGAQQVGRLLRVLWFVMRARAVFGASHLLSRL